MQMSQPTSKSANSVTFKFAGHETFTFRYGWLKKAVDGIGSDPKVFKRDDAIVEFGVGKNMVQSIKFWGLATQVLEEENKELKVSNFGHKLLNQWDPFLEDPASLWLTHWLLATNPSRAAVWYLAFNKYPRPDFTKDQILEFIVDYADRHSIKIKGTTIGRDVDCFIRTYLPVQKAKTSVEDKFSCPLNELELLSKLRDNDSYQFNIGPKPSLPSEVIGYALLTYIKLEQSRRKTISISDCLYRAGSPGQVFKLDENSLVEYVEQLQKSTAGSIELDETAGLKQVYAKNELDPESLLETYYG
ncbi:DUF4007 family protein [Dethiobacter alkaliphilus]|uniref:DUF4007 domain-containing protein n=1 Tax=Dethiobacter alkaliphilus AHT 1 TaxID=555088 RepID=C0GD35_DETAL|nr:DUF4007 family protein [Dethiobacter alkaliphilus]EEG79120.1 conserved hypothetical protein [Dethiobacter alkaliphilus AHT 1]